MSRAFTLIEMMVTVSIIAIITTFTVVNLGFQRPERRVEQVTRELYGALSYARNLAVTGKVFKDEDGDGKPDVPNGYGMLFRVVLTGSNLVLSTTIYGDLYTSGVSKKYDIGETFGIPNNLEIKLSDFSISLYLDGIFARSLIPTGPLTFPQTTFFSTQRGDITYYNVANDVSLLVPPVAEIGIELASTKNLSVKKRVVINRVTGQIYVNENP